MTPSRVLFLGPPGVGKGTQAQRISERFGLVVVGSGDTIRREIRDGSEIGRRAAQYVQFGALVPDEIITGVMLAGILKLPPEQGFILDGFPRTVPQAESLDGGLGRVGRQMTAVVHLTADDARIVARMVDRRVCSNCQTTYNVRSSPPRVAGVCDHCGHAVIQRVDDTEGVIRTRLETYRRQTAPLVEFYRRRGLLREVDGDQPAAQVEAAIIAAMSRCGEGE